MENADGVTLEFLEKALGSAIEKFSVKPGSVVGDGYMCAMHSVTVWKKPTATSRNSEPVTLIIKCYPSNAVRQEYLDTTLFFSQELGVYQEIIPELHRFQENLPVSKKVAIPFTTCVYGRYLEPEAKKNLGRPFHPLDNCIIMPDLRASENGSYSLRDRFLALDLDHYTLVIEAQARLHAVSWAYKFKSGGIALKDRFPFIAPQANQAEAFKAMESFLSSQCFSIKDMFKEDLVLVRAVDQVHKTWFCVSGLYFEVELGQTAAGYTKDSVLRRPDAVDDEEPWEVLVHGDAWTNNLMFRYDERTGRPVQVTFVDLQNTREGDPLTDICYTLYTSTHKDLRDKHLSSMLHLYFDTFCHFCKTFQVPTPPGYSWPEFLRRFRRTKIFGASFALLGLPVMLKKPEEQVDLDEIQVDHKESTESSKSSKSMAEDLGEMFTKFAASSSSNPALEARLRDVLQDMIADEIL